MPYADLKKASFGSRQNLFEQPVKKEVYRSLLMSGRGWDIKKRETVFNPAKGGTGILF